MANPNAPLLTQYGYLTWPRSVNEWFAEWNDAVESRNLLHMNALIHFGLRQHVVLSEPAAIQLFAHYLKVADGHRSERNFGQSGSQQDTPLGRMSHPKVLQTLAIKAWQELCLRFFKFSVDTSEETPPYRPLMLRPTLARAILDFIDPAIGRGERFFNTGRVNIVSNPETPDEYNTKALKFVKYYLRTIFDFGDDLPRLRQYFYYEEDPNQERLRQRKFEYDQSFSFFFNERPRLIVMMNYYGELEYLRGRPLNEDSLHEVEKLALGSTWDGERPRTEALIEDVAHELDPAYNIPVHILPNRTAVDIVVQHPQVKAAHGRWVAERARMVELAREREIAETEQQLSDIQNRLTDMRRNSADER